MKTFFLGITQIENLEVNVVQNICLQNKTTEGHITTSEQGGKLLYNKRLIFDFF